MTQTMLSVVEDAEIEAFWAKQPRRLFAPAPPDIPIGAVTVSITCRVCGARDKIVVEWSGLLCRGCRADLARTRDHVWRERAQVDVREAQAGEAWAAQLAALESPLLERWDRALMQRTQAEAKVARLSNARLYRTDLAAHVARIEEARAELAAIREKFARTATNEANPLCALVRSEQAYHAELQQLRDARVRWEIALQEIEAAETGGVPF